jgi:hypothetical protein
MLILCLVALSQTAAKPAPVKVDRSGEPALRQLLTDMGRIRGAQIEIIKSGRGTKDDTLSKDHTIDLWFDSPSRFRVEENTLFGGAVLYVSDGKALLTDQLDDTSTPVVTDAKGDIPLNSDSLAAKGEDSALTFYMFSGPMVIDKLVAKDSPVTSSKDFVSFKSADSGDVKLFFEGPKGSERVTRIEYDNMPYYTDLNKKYPEFYPVPDGPLTIEEISYLAEGRRFKDEWFTPSPGKNRPVEDRRKKHS